jgi:hypothetical protein
MLSISVTNLSSFPLTISEVGFTSAQGAKLGKRAMIFHPRPSTAKDGRDAWNHAQLVLIANDDLIAGILNRNGSASRRSGRIIRSRSFGRRQMGTNHGLI